MNRHGTVVVSDIRREARVASPFDNALLVFAVLGTGVTAASLFGRAGWLLELMTHFRFQMAAAALLLFALALVRRRIAAAALAALAAGMNGVPLAPYLLVADTVAEAASPGLRVMAANVSYRNFDYAALLDQIRETDPDVVGLVEVDQEWLDGLSALETEFAWRLAYPLEGPRGLALFSKLPFEELPHSPYMEDGVQASLAVELEAGQTPVTLVLAHVSAPVTPAEARLRNRQLTQIAGFLDAGGRGHRILLGDLNITPWSPFYADLAAATSLTNAARGFGYHPTWPAGFNVLKIPIDHCLVSDGLQVVSFRTGSDFGSDHLPIVVELAMRADADHAGDP